MNAERAPAPSPPRSTHPPALRPMLLPLVPLYRAGLAFKNRRYDRHPTLARELRDPVIGVGGLSAGGSGKTPFLIALANLLREMGYAPDVLSRGYGRTSRGVLQVDPQGTADRFGDEPLLLARTLGAPVYVGAERYQAGLLAETGPTDSHRGVHLLDDGFQHRRLARTVDIVLLTAEDVDDVLLPAGNLREPLSALARADIVVLRSSEADALAAVLGGVLHGSDLQRARRGVAATSRRHAPRAPRVWTVDRQMTLPATLPTRPIVFSGIARPGGFESMLAQRGVNAAATHRFRDHHRYTPHDARTLLRLLQGHAANGYVTTAKDAVKLDAAFLASLRSAGPLAVADAVVHLRDRDRCAAELRSLLCEDRR